MRLIELHLNRLPGIHESFCLKPSAGINLILGANGTGKSSICRAMGNLLWAERPGDRPFSVRAVFEIGDERWTVSREDRDPPEWSREGTTVSTPRLPAAHLAPCYLLGLPEMLAMVALDGDRELASVMAEQLAGGYNLPRAALELFSSGPQAGKTELKKWQEASDGVRQLQLGQGDLLRRQEGLPDLLAELAYARRAERRAQTLVDFREREIKQKDLKRAEAILADFPAEVANVRSEDPAKVKDLKEGISRQEDELATLRSERGQTALDIEALDLSAAARSDLDLEGMEDRTRRLTTQQESCHQADRTLAACRDRLGVLPEESSPGSDSLPALDPETLGTMIRLQQRLLRHQIQVDELESLEKDSLKTGAGLPWWLTSLAGIVLLLGSAGALLWADNRIPVEGLLVAGLIGAALLAMGLFSRGRALGSRPDPRLAARKADAEKKRNQDREALAALKADRALDLDVENPLLPDLIRIAEDRRSARRELAEATAELTTREDQFSRELADLNGEFSRLGVPEATDAPSASARCRSFLTRREQWESLVESDRQAARSEATLGEHLERIQGELADISKRLGLESGQDPADLANALLADQPAWTRAGQERDTAGRDIQRLTGEIDAHGDLLGEFELDDCSPEDLDGLIETELNKANTLEELVKQRTELETEIARAIGDEALAQAMVRQEERLQDLAEVRQAVREDELGRMLCEDVLAQQDHDADSPLVKSARELFADFTAGRYDLRVGSGPEDDPFLAEDRSLGKTRRLSELSDGARSQLMLAVRMAFLIQAETGPKPPLFLDQALAASDPDRFHAMARNLGRVAREQDRQIFYLSCDPVDQEAWNRALEEEGLPPVHLIDLQVERRLAAASALPALNPPVHEPVPVPESLSAAQYGELLRVPRIDPWLPEDAIHLFHLLRDELPLLHQLMTAGVERLGQWRGQRNHLAASGAQSPAQAGRLEHRGQAAGAFLDAWHSGRGRPVASDWIRELEIFSKQKLPEILALNQAVDGNAERLMADLRAKKVKNLKTTFKDRFEEALIQAGCLDTQDPLTDGEQLLHVRRALAGPLLNGEIEAEEINRLTEELRHALESSASA